MKVAIRDALADLLLEALDDEATAATVRGLAADVRAAAAGPLPRTLAKKLRCMLTPDFEADWLAVRARLLQYGSVLEGWSGQAGAPALGVVLCKSALLFNHHLFFEVHEVLEPQWRQEQGESKRFLQGLIQIAVAFYHLGRGNLAGARSLLHEGLLKISPHSPAWLGVELRDFIAGLEQCQQLLSGLSPRTCQQFSPAMVPRMRLAAESW